MKAIGIDGGGSKTDFCLYDESGKVLNRLLLDEPSNYHLVGIDKVKAVISEGIKKVSQNYSFDVVGAGLSGVDREADRQKIISVFKELGIKKFFIQNDGVAALWGATGGVGILVIGGTGSIVIARNAEGEINRSGGWGYAFEEYCGGYWFVTKAIKALLDHKDGLEIGSILEKKLIEFFEVEKVEDLIYLYYSGNFDKAKISSGSKIVLEAAREEDEVAMNILKVGLENVMKMIGVLDKRSKFSGKFVFSYTGGIFKSKYFLKRFKRVFEIYFPQSTFTDPKFDPSVGAAMMAIHEERLNG
jgi:N-acetylglucosamine kinase-like BadF-type ATPase